MSDASLGVLNGDGWCIERTEQDGKHSVMPLAGWLVLSDGELRPLPLSLGKEWTVRPRLPSDDSSIQATSLRLRPNTTTNWSNFP